MTSGIFLIVLFAAFLHALWNAIVKGADDKTVMLGLVALGHVIPGVLMVIFFAPPTMATAPYIIASTAIHWGYYVLLNYAYRLGDFSVTYPIARGMTPILIALGAQFWVGEQLTLAIWVGIIAVSIGIMLLTAVTVKSSMPKSGLIAAGAAAFFIAGYSLVDGVGVRLSGSPVGYVGWLFVLEIFVTLYIFTTRWERFKRVNPKTIAIGFAGGVVSAAAYGLVLYAKTVAPLGVISALRETSVIFAALIGVYWFSEGPKKYRIFASMIVAAGIVLIAIAGGH